MFGFLICPNHRHIHQQDLVAGRGTSAASNCKRDQWPNEEDTFFCRYYKEHVCECVGNPVLFFAGALDGVGVPGKSHLPKAVTKCGQLIKYGPHPYSQINPPQTHPAAHKPTTNPGARRQTLPAAIKPPTNPPAHPQSHPPTHKPPLRLELGGPKWPQSNEPQEALWIYIYIYAPPPHDPHLECWIHAWKT